MSYTLILPVSGQSSRFEGMRPKWLLTMPDGKLMLEKAIEKLDLAVFSRIIVVCLQEHIDRYANLQNLQSSFLKATERQAEFLVLAEATSSQSETIYQALVKGAVDGPFFIKDCDNIFACAPQPKNCVATINLNDIGLVDAKNKSYVEVDSLGIISNIVEKNVISNQFCCGGYGFSSAKRFIASYKSINSSDEIYISHIIYKMLLESEEFSVLSASEYEDWGTQREYRHYCREFVTVFCDVDGVLLRNGSKFNEDGWKTVAIEENLQKLIELQKKGLLYLVLTSSRPKDQISYTVEHLKQKGLAVDECLFGLPHARRLLINDFSKTNPYPSAVAINLERDSQGLSELLS